MSEERLADRFWRLNNLYKIRDKDGLLVTFRPNRAQRHFAAVKHTRNLILKSRQLGFTTFGCIEKLDSTLFTKDKIIDADIIAHRDKDVMDIFENKIEFAWKNLDEQIKKRFLLDTHSKRELAFGLNGGKSKSLNRISVTNSSRSGSKTHVHVTELAFLDKKRPGDAKEIISGCAPTLGIDGIWDIESTARGRQGEFYDMCMQAHERQKKGIKANPKDFKLHFYNWTWDDYEMSKITQSMIEEAIPEMRKHPEFDEIQAQYKYTVKQMVCYYFYWTSLKRDWELLRQEYPNTIEEAFAASADNLFDAIAVSKLEEKIGRRSGNWIFFKEYNRNHVYGLGADVSEGIGGDSSAIVIWDFSTAKPEIVAVFCSDRISPDDLAYEIANGGRLYGECIVAPERNNHGHATIAILKKIYPTGKIYRMKREDQENPQETDRLGWETNLSTKPRMFHDLRTGVNMEAVNIYDETIKSEMTSYQRDSLNERRANPDQTQHWDKLTAAAIGYQIRNIPQMPVSQRVGVVEAKYN